MPRVELGEALSFIDVPDAATIRLRPGRRKRRSVWFATAIGLSVHAAVLAAFLNFIGVVRIPRLEWLTRDHLLADRGATAPPAQPTPAGGMPSNGTRGATTPSRAPQPSPRRTVPPRGTLPPSGTPQPGQAKKQADDPTAPRSKAAAPLARMIDPATARALLESKGLVRAGSGFVLESESDVASKLVVLRKAVADWSNSAQEAAELQQAVDSLPFLNQTIIDDEATIGDLTRAMDRFPVINWGGRNWHGANMLDEAAYQGQRVQRAAVQQERDFAVWRRDTLRNQQVGRRLAEAKEKLEQKAGAARAARSDARDAEGATSKRYQELADDGEVGRALAKLGVAGVGASPQFRRSVDELRALERSAGLSKVAGNP